MANADEFCQFARLGQTSKIQKCLQTHSDDRYKSFLGVDINALNLYGESALSTATYYNQILCVEYLLTNKADPKLRLSAGHTAVHIACRLANISMLHLLLTIKKDENNEERPQEKEDKHLYECLRIKDNANLTPIHWAATQESVSKRQKVFAYLDRRMPGVLDSRYNINWFNSWAQIHPWVIEQKSTNSILTASPVRLLPKLMNTDHVYRQYCEQGSSLPMTNVSPLVMTPKISLNDYERTPRPPPPTAATNTYYDYIHEKNKHISSKIRLVQIEHPSQTLNLPPTPITSRIVTSKHPISKYEHAELPYTQKQAFVSNNIAATSQKTPYSQRLSSIIKHSFSPLSDRSTYRAERAHVIPTFNYPLSPATVENRSNKGHDYEDMTTPISSKRPSHNLLSNIVPSTTTSSSDQSSRQSTKPFASLGFDTSIDPRNNNDTTTLSTIETYTQHDEQNDAESLFEDEENEYEINQFDYLCKSASTLGISSPGGYTYDA